MTISFFPEVPLRLITFFFILFPTFAQASSPLILDNPTVLLEMEQKGLSFAEKIVGTKVANNKTLYQNKAYKSFVDFIKSDLDEIISGDPYLSVTMAKKHRLFDKKWLQSKHSRFELVGVVSRMDRSSFSTHPSYQCGEVRLIYRLSYDKVHRGEPLYSRLPLTVNLVYWMKDSTGAAAFTDCPNIAKKWEGADLKKTLSKNQHLFQLSNLKSLEINLQAVRWPSTVRPDFGGYAEYLMRVFKYNINTQAFHPDFMENMIDVAKIKSTPSLKTDLLNHLKDKTQVSLFDRGIGVLPDRFLAKKALSVAFHGQARLKNRPFDQIFSANDFKQISFKESEFVKTPQAYLRRLNDMTCVGCHQSRSIAGFHFVGVDRPNTFAANSVQMARSGHLQMDLLRRKKFMENLSQGQQPNFKRGFSERLDTEPGKYGAHCTLGKDISFEKWTCTSGLTCQSIDTAKNNDLTGICLPEKNQFAGDPCDVGRITQNLNSRKDRVTQKKHRACREGQYCFEASDGFPGGLCYSECDNLKPGEGCGLIAFNGFNSCLGQNKPFSICLKEFTGKLSLKSCSTTEPCRDDFVCARSTQTKGTCIPPYFLFQLRVDGHPRP